MQIFKFFKRRKRSRYGPMNLRRERKKERESGGGVGEVGERDRNKHTENKI